jgi:hypothetical protein
MAFTEKEIAEHTITLEKHFWSTKRPPVNLRPLIREGQRFSASAIELFFVRPRFNRPGQTVEESIAKIRYVRRTNVWLIFWKRADLKWHSYPPQPEAESLVAALKIVKKDPNGCFFG